MTTFQEGDWVLLTSQRGKKWLVTIQDAPFSSHIGTIQMLSIVGKEEGDYVETNKGAKVFLLRPTLEDYIFKMKRHTQIIYPKDLGAILIYGDIHTGNMVLETGVGSGALTLALLRAVGQSGRVISIEKRPEFASGAKQNIRAFYRGDPGNHHIVVGDIQSVSLKIKADRAVVDLPEPWRAISSISPHLRQGALLVSLSPNVGQVQLTCRELKAGGYTNISTFELLKRDWLIDELRARPADRMIAHTGFLTVAKKAWRLSSAAPTSETGEECRQPPDTISESQP